MPGYILHFGATVTCMHAGQAMPTAPNPRVKVMSQPVATSTAPYTVAGCPFVPPSGNGPCVTAQWITFATRVRAGGQPVVLQDSQALCTPTATGLMIVATQVRVKGQ